MQRKKSKYDIELNLDDSAASFDDVMKMMASPDISFITLNDSNEALIPNMSGKVIQFTDVIGLPNIIVSVITRLTNQNDINKNATYHTVHRTPYQHADAPLPFYNPKKITIKPNESLHVKLDGEIKECEVRINYRIIKE